MTRLGKSLVGTARRMTLGVAATIAVAALVVPDAIASPESDAADAINQAWQAAGGADSPVGNRDGDVFEVGSGYGEKFSEGKIFFTPETGAHLIYGDILNKYESLGGPADSDLGFPTINEVAGLVGPDSRVSTFSASDKPAIFWTPDTGAWAVRGAINVAWDKLGGSAGALGVPVEDERYDGDVISQKFTGGELSWNTASKTFTSDPPSFADELGGLEVPTDPTTLINQAWRATGGLGGPLGARQGEQTAVGDGGAAQDYASGKIFYSPATGAHAVTGAILSKYESLGGPTGDLGFPVGVETEGGVPNSRVSAFSAPDKPVIFWTPDNGAIVVRGAINAAWDKLGGATGALGVPTGEESVQGDTVTQNFSGGELSWNSASKEFSSKPPSLASSLSGLEIPDAMGQTPAGTTPAAKPAKTSGWHWWWLAIIIPVLLLLGLLALWAQRRGGSHEVAERHGAAPNGDRWPGEGPVRARYQGPDVGSEGAQASGFNWSPPTGEDVGFDSDEDKIDTAPTRIPSAANLTDFGSAETTADRGWDAESDSGRHTVEAGASMWRLDLDDIAVPRRRHAAEPSPSWWSDTEQDAGEQSDHRGGESDLRYQDEVVEEVTITAEETEQVEPAEDEAPLETSASENGDVDAGHEPWRPAIHLPLADPYQAPEGYVIKANTHSGLYYTPESVLYDNTLPEVWFATEELARANGFVKAPE